MASTSTLGSLKRGLKRGLKRSLKRIQYDMPQFEFHDLDEKEVIGRGSYGIVYKARDLSEEVVIKKILGESTDEEESFIKEAKLIKSLKHQNIVSFKGFCASPLAIMLEYVYFDFNPFEITKKVSNLADFINFLDKVDAFESFDSKMLNIICRDVAEGLEYLHCNDTAHRDLKAKNILVSNQHYSSLINGDERQLIYHQNPIVCKLADFGESRSTSIQTAQLHSTTKHVDRYAVYSK
jgi:serine/threonine protein kinase